MNDRGRSFEVGHSFSFEIEEIEDNSSTLHDYGLRQIAWRRAASLLSKHQTEQALQIIDDRAERAVNGGRYEAACRWRELLAAIHAICTDERLPGENVH